MGTVSLIIIGVIAVAFFMSCLIMLLAAIYDSNAFRRWQRRQDRLFSEANQRRKDQTLKNLVLRTKAKMANDRPVSPALMEYIKELEASDK